MTAPEILEEDSIVSAYDADFQNNWKPAAIFRTIQKVGGKHADLLGYSYERMASIQRAWILSRIKIRFFKTPLSGETVTVRTAPKGIQQKIFFIRDSQIVNSAGAVVAAATTAWLVIDMESWRILPAAALGFELPKPVDFIGLDDRLDKLPVPDGLPEQQIVTATYNTLDVMGHVNNARYPEWVTDCFSVEHYRSHHLDWMQINYNHEVKPGEQVALLSGCRSEDPSVWYVQGINRQDGRNCFDAALGWSPR